MFFARFPEFVLKDNRNSRVNSPVTIESLSRRCEAFLPSYLLKNKTVLDLGCCIGAMGHWSLANGAVHYTGVELQSTYANLAGELLSAHWKKEQYEIVHSSIEDFLLSTAKKYDVVVLLGSLYSMLDVFGTLEKVCRICSEVIVLDSMYPVFNYHGLKVIEIVDKQIMNSADDQRSYSGVGVRPTPEAIEFILEKNGFSVRSEEIRPLFLEGDEHDAFNDLQISGNRPLLPSRFAYHFERKGLGSDYRIESAIKNKNTLTLTEATRPEIIRAGSWAFDEKVARGFFQEALNNIPDYIKVIDLCVNIAEKKCNKDALILEVGSALGLTVEKFLRAGFKNTFGVERSPSMVRHSACINHIYISEHLPVGKKWDLIVANWTLHFIEQRKEYIESIYSALNPGGIFILSDKMDSNQELQEQYVAFKLERGMTPEEIQNKARSIEGVLTTRALTWYLDTLKNTGFEEIEIINTRLMFNTISCKKRGQ